MYLAVGRISLRFVLLLHGEDGLPLGVHRLVGRPVGEAMLLVLAAQLEAVRPWAARRPELAAQTSV